MRVLMAWRCMPVWDRPQKGDLSSGCVISPPSPSFSYRLLSFHSSSFYRIPSTISLFLSQMGADCLADSSFPDPKGLKSTLNSNLSAVPPLSSSHGTSRIEPSPHPSVIALYMRFAVVLITFKGLAIGFWMLNFSHLNLITFHSSRGHVVQQDIQKL